MNESRILREAFLKREAFFALGDDTAFRLFNAEGDGIPGLTVDCYHPCILIQNFRDTELSPALINSVITEASAVLPGIAAVLLKSRSKVSDGGDAQEQRRSVLIDGHLPEGEHVVRHMGRSFAVDVMEALNTGLFMDMRDVRRSLEPYLDGASVLNLFSYTCAFGVHALTGGARFAVNADIASPVLERGKRNYELNALAVNPRDFIRDGAESVIKVCRKRGMRYSLVIIDPPTFAKSRRGSFSVKRDLARLLAGLDGVADMVLSAVNTHGFTRHEYEELHPASWQQLFSAHEASDYPAAGEPYLKAALWKTV